MHSDGKILILLVYFNRPVRKSHNASFERHNDPPPYYRYLYCEERHRYVREGKLPFESLRLLFVWRPCDSNDSIATRFKSLL